MRRAAPERALERVLVALPLRRDQHDRRFVGRLDNAHPDSRGKEARLVRRGRITEHAQRAFAAVWLNEQLDGAVACARHRVLLDVGLGLDPIVRDAHESRLAAADRFLRGADDDVLRAAATDPAVQRSVGKHDRLRTDKRRRGRDGADHGDERIRLAPAVQFARQVQQLVVGHHRASMRLGSTRSMEARSAPGARRSMCGSAACMPRLTGVKSGRPSSGLSQTTRRAR